MKVLVIGRGGREHAIVRQFASSPSVGTVYAAPGSDGMTEAECIGIGEMEFDRIAEFSKENGVDFVFVGPEQPLSEGLSDYLEEAGIRVFGPSKAAARIESSKTFAKEFMMRHGIPTAKYASFTDAGEAAAYIRSQGAPIVVKADGLAAGKGVVVAETEAEAIQAAEDMLKGQKFGESGSSVVIEEYLEGEEFSFMSFVHGSCIFPMPLSQDHKRAYDGDKGPNTGGMGAYSPVPFITSRQKQEAFLNVVKPAADALEAEGYPFTGVLYAGLIQTREGAKVIEFNARFGDPETQVVLPLLDSDFGEFIDRLLAGEPFQPEWKEEAVLGVVLAAEGYPAVPEKGIPLPRITETGHFSVYHSGTKKQADGFVSNGGRVLMITASRETLEEAADAVYRVIGRHAWPGLFWRHDIGWRAKKRTI
ncbi:phosphoribosylamine--glycine ligase [Indiicoccus explosivorum]|uniref:phosphoribosylamine--glycine ligase n=1 Tax=Indiicoccus explosivorum TaxID=1917864 RepID=UPI000B437614|nr:phosphoribosylamine--glycine ligase [Indiicoccus explosivorum]